MTAKLSITHLTKKFPKTNLRVLGDISLHVNQGEFVSLIGPSGCGKSTLFHIIAGIEEPTSGTIIFDGNVQTKRVGHAGYMLQNPLLLPWRTVLENVLLGMDILGISQKQSRQRGEELLKQFGLAEFCDNYPHVLSGGMKQRVALLRTILFCQDFLLLDEPFGALDALTRLSCQLWLLDLWQTYKSSILFITHDISEAILLSNRIYVFGLRPAKIVGEFIVNLPFPRKKEDITNKKAVEMEKQLLKVLVP